ncbi:2077_t:CDS:10 [Acaulospora morrowiae]|uniref:2077_t:CDS:1 n=1 Tax=Acaulospora morrowiae TaxID=94023 RepID=A0A9N8V7G2_9GLOM|nr:2077_t:CDS:10 [Acaulospora morrowiae]
MNYKLRLSQFESILSTKNLSQDPTIDLYKFRHLCFRGIPDKPGIRQKSWKILLGYLPPDKRKWEKVLTEQRTTYYSFVRDLLADPSEEELKNPHNTEDHVIIVHYIIVIDNPLNSAPNSKWAEYFADNIILEQIDKDVRRTLPDFAFFQLPVPHSPLSPLSPKLAAQEICRINGTRSPSIMDALDGSNDDDNSCSNSILTNPELESDVAAMESTMPHLNSIGKNKFSTAGPKPLPIDVSELLYNTVTPIPTRRSIFKRVQHLNKEFGARRSSSPSPSYKSDGSRDDDYEVDLHWEAIERILFIYAKLNPGVGYVQGMNEILGPIYYTMANDSDEVGKAHAEADSFFVFTLMMSHIRDHFVRSLDMDDKTGIGHTMMKMNRRLRTFEPELWADLERKSLHPTYYSFRWLTVMLSQEFALPDVIRLWDSILADHDDEETTGGFEFLLDFSCAMLICVKDQLLRGSFADNIKLLQNYPIQDPAIVLSKAYALREKRLLAKMYGEDIDASSESGDDDDYYPPTTNGNVYYESSTPSAIQRANDVKIKGLAMLKKVQGVVNNKPINGIHSNGIGFSSSQNIGNTVGIGGMSGFAMRFSNVWRKNIIASSS